MSKKETTAGKKKSISMQIRFSESMHEWLETEAEKKDISMAWIIRNIITQHIENRGGKA